MLIGNPLEPGGFFNRLEASRKFLFGAASVYGKANESVIVGAFLVRGQEAQPAFDVAPDFDSFNFVKLDPSKTEDREFVEDQWELEKPVVVNGQVRCSASLRRCRTVLWARAFQVNLLSRPGVSLRRRQGIQVEASGTSRTLRRRQTGNSRSFSIRITLKRVMSFLRTGPKLDGTMEVALPCAALSLSLSLSLYIYIYIYIF